MRVFLLLLIYGMLAIATAFVDLRVRAFPNYPFERFIPDVLSGTAGPPAIYRVLAPYSLVWTAQLLGYPLKALWYVSRLAGFWVAYLVFHFYLRTWFSPTGALMGTLLVAATLPLTFTNSWGHPDHVAELILFTAGCLAIARAWDVVFAAVLVLAALNRETSVFLVVLYAVAARLDRGRLLRTGAFAALWAAIYVGLRATRGFQTYDPLQIRQNLAFLKLLPAAYDPYYRRYAYFGLAIFGPLLVVASTGWRVVPSFARRALVVVPLFVAVAFTFSSIIETRIFTPLYPLILPAVVGALGHWQQTVPGDGYELAS